jgi:hypothetical protein
MLYHPDPDPPEEEISDRRRHRLFGIGWLIVVLAMAAGAWYAYPILKRHDAAVARFASVQKVVDNLGDQARQADERFQSWSTDRDQLREQMSKLGQRVQAGIETTRKQARESSAELLHNVQARIDGQMNAMEARLGRLESSSDTEQTRMAEMQRDLGQVRGEMAKQADELTAVRRQLEENGASHDRQLASLKENEANDRRDVNMISRNLSTLRVDFEVTKNHSRELAEGISLGVTGTDIRYRRVTGWMWVLPDRRTIWLRGQGAQEPVVFYGVKDGKKRELVITNVGKNSVTGYLLLPLETSSESAAASE